MMVNLHKKILGSGFCLLLLAGCSIFSSNNIQEYGSLEEEVSAIKSDGGVYKVGNPYTALGQHYTPREDYNYSEVGMASWYGSDFHNKRTANGERYNMHAVTAAHRTLPLPSIVKVTNLENGRTIIARVNDRGPYVKNRIIDLSQKGAELLGYKNQGTTKVKVEILADASKALKEAMLSADNTSEQTNQNVKYGLNGGITVKTAQNTVAAKQAQTNGESQQNVARSGTYFVQVGAFSDLSKAKQMAQNMERFGKVSIYEAYLSKDGVYRVRIGAYPSRDEALQILDRVLDYGHADVTIVEG